MPQLRLILPALARPRDPTPGSEGAVTAGSALRSGERIRVQPLDAEARTVGGVVEVDAPEALPVEGRGEGGTPRWAFAAGPLSLSLDVPDGTETIRVEAEGTAPTMIPLNRVRSQSARAPDAVRRFPDLPVRWTLAVVSERFTDAEAFFERCASLSAFVQNEPAFGDAGVSFGITGLFWASPSGETLFGASDDMIQGRILQGDGALVRQFVAAAGIAPKKMVVLINSAHRAGAGGFARDIPSWTTISADLPERWEGIALHELGHAFGLADEYDSAFNLAEPSPLEPNVSRQPDPDATAWAHLCTAHAPPVPTGLIGAEGQHDLDTIGTFQGARYRPDRFRPSPNCRMRMTTAAFCGVCRAHIRRELTR